MPVVDPRAQILAAHGNKNPAATIAAAAHVGLPLHFAAACLEKESGGSNVWGHDPTIFVGGYDEKHQVKYGPLVTPAAYKAYLLQRGPKGAGGMQGVGPCQLTWYSLQDAADQIGGCWNPESNMRVGFQHLLSLIQRYGVTTGAAAYNGAGPAAVVYGQDFTRKALAWKQLLGA